MQSTRFRRLALVVAMSVVATSCGGDDVFPRDRFVQQVTANGVTRPVAECTYDGIVDDPRIMEELNRTGGPNSEISAAVDEKMSRVIARCFLEAESDADSEADSESGSEDADTTTTSRK